MVVIDTRIPLDSQFPVYVLADSSQFVLCSCIYFILFTPVFSIELTSQVQGEYKVFQVHVFYLVILLQQIGIQNLPTQRI